MKYNLEAAIINTKHFFMSTKELDNIIYTTVINAGYSSTLADLLVAQAHQESTQDGIPYNNKAYRLGNNAFGYKYVKGAKYQSPEEGNVSSEGNTYAKYPSLENSVLEVLSWLQRRQKEGKFVIANLQTEQDYAEALKSGDYYGVPSAEYAKGLSYYSKLFQGTLINFYKKNPNTTYLLIGGVLVVGASLYALRAIKKSK